jgi:hypothetical protein
VGDWLCSEVECLDRRGECWEGRRGDFGNNGDLEVKRGRSIFLLLFVLFSGVFWGLGVEFCFFLP